MRRLRDLSDWAKDAIHVTVNVHFDFMDRLRILFGAEVILKVRTDCESAPGRVESETDLMVLRVFPSRRKMELGTVTAEEKKAG